VTEPVHIIGFLSQWKLYLDQLPGASDADKFRGSRMDPTVFEKVRAARPIELHDQSEYTS
jgi:hypothetical protein